MSRELLARALDALLHSDSPSQKRADAIAALRAALAAPQPEPVAWIAVADKMPPEDVPCWLYEPGIGAWIGGWSCDDDGWLWHHCHGSQYMDKDGEWESNDAEADDYSPTHWMPLPAAPGAAPPAAPADQTTSMDYGMFVDEATNPPAPAVREPLTDEQIIELRKQAKGDYKPWSEAIAFARAVLAADRGIGGGGISPHEDAVNDWRLGGGNG